MFQTKVNPFVQSAFAPPSMMIVRHGGIAQPMDCSTPALDLCVRKNRTPSPECAQMMNKLIIYPESPSSSSPESQATSEYCDSSIGSDSYPVTTSPGAKPKIPRPFKAYPKDPLSLALGVVSTEALLSHNTAEAYQEFRHKMLSQVQFQHQGTNKNMRRNTLKTANVNEDPTYWEKRKKNNEAAKRSRDARRAKEDEIAIRCAFLEQENLKLKYENVAFKNEIERLRNMV